MTTTGTPVTLITDIIAAVNLGQCTIAQAVDAAVARHMEYALEYFSPNMEQLVFWDIRAAWQARQPAAPPAAPPVRDTRPVLHCRCGNTGHAGAYPFSTLPGSGRCDDCV